MKRRNRKYRIPKAESKKMIELAMEAGVIFGLECHAWGNRKKVSEDMALEFFGEDDKEAIRASHDLIDRLAVAPVTSPQGKARSLLLKESRPWLTSGVYFVEDWKVEHLTNKIEEFIAESSAALEVLLANYDDEKRKFKEKHPRLYKEAVMAGRYPTKESLKRRFSMRYFRHYITPPVNGKVGILTKEEMEIERRKWEDQVRESMEYGIRKAREALAQIFTHLRDCLVDPSKTFKDSTVEKPKEFLRRIADVPVWGDKPLEKLAKDAADLLDGVYAEDLRDDDDYRKVIGGAVDAMVKEFESLPVVEMERDLDF